MTHRGVASKGTEEEKESHSVFITVFISLLLDLLAFTLILPLFPALLEYYKANDGPEGLYNLMESYISYLGNYLGVPGKFNNVLFGGILGSLFSFLQFVGSPLIGSLSDHYGRRPLLLFSSAGIVVSYIVWACAGSFKIFVLARILGGLAKGNVSLCTAIITDVSSVKNRGKGMALIGIAFSLGFIIGPLIGAAFSLSNSGKGSSLNDEKAIYVAPALVATFLSLLNFFYLFLYFEESLPLKSRRHSSSISFLTEAFHYINPISIFRFASLASSISFKEHESLKTIGLVYFLYLFIYSGLEFTLTFITHSRFAFTSMEQGKMFLFIGLLMAVLQGILGRRIPAGKEKNFVLRGLLLLIPSFALIGLADSQVVLYIGLSLYAISTAFVVPCMNTLVSNYGDSHQKGLLMGIYRSLGALGRASGPVFTSLLYWAIGPELTYCLGALSLLVPYLLLKQS